MINQNLGNICYKRPIYSLSKLNENGGNVLNLNKKFDFINKFEDNIANELGIGIILEDYHIKNIKIDRNFVLLYLMSV